MQSEGIGYCGYVVLDSYNMSYGDEDSILDQKYEKQMSWDLYYEDFKFYKWIKKIHIKRNTAHNNKELENWVLVLLLYENAFLYNIIKYQNHHKNNLLLLLHIWYKMLSSC